MENQMNLVWPALEYLDSYTAALRRGWSPDNMRQAASLDELERIETDPVHFISEQVDRDAKGPPVRMSDGSTRPRIPGYRRWMWDGEFCGTIGFRWQPGTTELPPHCLGHIGYAVVPWKRQRGYATRALELIMHDVRNEDVSGLTFVDLTVEESNLPSRRVIEANGGKFVERFSKIDAHGGGASLRYRIHLDR